jgi:hypothetical protein
MEMEGDSRGARNLLREACQRSPRDVAALTAYAEHLDRYRDPQARQAYADLLKALDNGAETAPRRQQILKRMVTLHLLAGDREQASRYLQMARDAGHARWEMPAQDAKPQWLPMEMVPIPGPLRSFSRMAALAPESSPPDLMIALARNVVTNGYQASLSTESLEPTEYLKLIVRYLSQARELEQLAGPEKVIRIEECESQQTGELLRVLGYRMRGGCGSDVVLETVNATRAFLTIDSGFPLAELEQDLRSNRPFVMDYRPTMVPVVFSADYWLGAAGRKHQGEFIDAFLTNPSLCRLYLGLAKLDPPTAQALKDQVDVKRLRTFAHVLDFYGGMFHIRNGKAVVPGGDRMAGAWTEMVGVSPDKGAAFLDALIAKDDGWMASYFDSLLRIEGPTLAYLTEPNRLKRFYQAIRGKVTSPGPARPVFRANADMMMLTVRLRVSPDGRPYVPGNLEVWKKLIAEFPKKRIDKRLQQAAPSWKDSDDLIEALFALCRKSVENEPLRIYTALSELDRKRTRPLEPATVARLANEFSLLGAQYVLFSEAPELSDRTIEQFLDVAKGADSIRNQGMRADVVGTFQALLGLWQIAVRQEAIPQERADASLTSILNAFTQVRRHPEIFEAARSSLETLFEESRVSPKASAQERMLDLLAGPGMSNDSTYAQLVQEMTRVFEAQKLVSLDALLGLAANLEQVSKGGKLDTALVDRVAARLSEVQPPRAALTPQERNSVSYGYWSERHINTQLKLNLRTEIQKAGTDAGKLSDITGELARLMRDTLIGFNYIEYAPPGAQVLLTNPVFVRSHDFVGPQGANQTWMVTEVYGSGWPTSAGGRLTGSLVGLPYALAQAEQNFLIPSREQALIWGDLVPQMLVSAKVPRWWKVAPAQMHYVGLHLRYAESALAESVVDSGLRERVLENVSRLAAPGRVYKARQHLLAGEAPQAIETFTPAELYFMAQDLLAQDKDEGNLLAAAIGRMSAADPQHMSQAAISRAFGTPKPTLTNSYASELLRLRTFPTLMGYSSRIMAESWESNTLYYAALADEAGMRPSALNVHIPDWTRRTVERIFATHLEDWPALLRSLRQVGEDVRASARQGASAGEQALLRE